MSEKQILEIEKNETVAKVGNFWQRNQKSIIYAVTVIVVIIGGWFLYKEMIVKPKEEKATQAIFKAEQFFAKDSFKVALEGNGQNKGFKYIINNYEGAKAANLAKYYAGICYLKLNDFNNAVKFLKDFDTDAKQIKMMAHGCLGDAYSELNKKPEAIESYKKAAAIFEEDEFNASEYLFRAALLNETMGKTDEAVSLYKEVKEKFPKTEKGFQADKYIYRLSREKND